MVRAAYNTRINSWCHAKNGSVTSTCSMQLNTTAFFDSDAKVMAFEIFDDESREVNEYFMQLNYGFCNDSITTPNFHLLTEIPPVPLEEDYLEVRC